MVINYLKCSVLYYKIVTRKSKILIIFYLHLLRENQTIRGGDWLCEQNKSD